MALMKVAVDNPTKFVMDTWVNDREKSKYPKQFEEIDKRYAEYRENHLEEFDEVISMDYGGEDEARYVNGFMPDMSLSLEQAIMGYNAASEMEKKYGKSSQNYAEIPKSKPYYKVKKEFEEAHRIMKESWYAEVGLPAPDTFKKQKEVENKRYYWQAGKKLGTDESVLEDFGTGLVEYLTHTTRQQFMQNRLDSMTMDFVAFGDALTNRGFKTIYDAFSIHGVYQKEKQNMKITILVREKEDLVEYWNAKFKCEIGEDIMQEINRKIVNKRELCSLVQSGIELVEQMGKQKYQTESLEIQGVLKEFINDIA